MRRDAGNEPLGRGGVGIAQRWKCRVFPTVPRDGSDQPPIVTAVAIQPGGTWIAVAGDNHVLSLLDRGRGEYVSHFPRHHDWIRTIRFSPDGRWLVTGGNDGRLLLWTMDRPGEVRSLGEQAEAIAAAAFSPDGTQIACVGFNAVLRLFGPGDRPQRQLECPSADMNCVAFDADGKRLAAAGRCGTIRVWEIPTGRPIHEITTLKRRVRSLEFTTGGSLVAAGDDGAVAILDPQRPNDPRTLPRTGGKLYAARMIDASLLATGGSDDLIHLWDLNANERIDSLAGHTGTVSCLDAAGGILVSGSFDTQVRIWESQQEVAAPANPERLGSRWQPPDATR